jgi:hypothetical protein
LPEHLQMALSLLLMHFHNRCLYKQFSLFWVMVFTIWFSELISGTPVYLRYLWIENINWIHIWTKISQ